MAKKYIDADRLRARMENLKINVCNSNATESEITAALASLDFVIRLINSLQQEQPEPSKSLEEAAERQINEAIFKWSYDDEDGIEQYVHDAFIAGADFGAKKMLAKLKENCVIIDKDFYEAAMEGRFIEGKEEGKKLMEEQNRKKEDER